MQALKNGDGQKNSDLYSLIADVPDWVPSLVFYYLAHHRAGYSYRALARISGCAPSTILRRIGRIEARRGKDQLFRWGLRAFEEVTWAGAQLPLEQREHNIMARDVLEPFAITEGELEKEGCRILRRLCEPRAILAVSEAMESAVVMRVNEDGEVVRTATTTQDMAKIFALKEWVRCASEGRVLKYHITSVGRKALKRMMSLEDVRKKKSTKAGRQMRTEEVTPYAEQHREWGTRSLDDPEDGKVRRMRYNIAETPILMLARRKTPDGKPFLLANQVNAGERLREDFEISQAGVRIGQNWERFLTGAEKNNYSSGSGFAGSMAARERFDAAIEAVGPGLRDILMLCCCQLVGVETAERSLGWSARSGKIVLRIALEQLSQHYTQGRKHRR